jgi:hypothetical protein
MNRTGESGEIVDDGLVVACMIASCSTQDLRDGRLADAIDSLKTGQVERR